MAVRQYIGARYTTKIYENTQNPGSAEWEAGATYEPLTLVTYLNGSYLSKKEVPGSVGNPPANPEYWVVTGAYNGQIASLQNQIDTINNTDLPNIQNQINTINNTELPNIREQVDTIQDEVSTLQRSNQKRVIFITDSYGGNLDGDGKNIKQLVQQYLGLSNDDYYSNSIGGACFAHPLTPETHNYLALLEALENNVTDKETISDIIVVGGANDLSQPANDTITAINNFMTYVKSTYPGAVVSLFACGIILTSAKAYDRYTQCIVPFKEINKYGGRFITNSEYVLNNSNLLQNDLCHLSQDGVTEVAKQVVNAIRSGACDVKYILPVDLTHVSDVKFPSYSGTVPTITPTYATFVMALNNGYVTFKSFGASPYFVQFITSAAVDFPVNGQIEIDIDQIIAPGYNIPSFNAEYIPAAVYNYTTKKKYEAVGWIVTDATDKMRMRLLLREPIPSTDNVTTLAVEFGSSMML